MRWVKRDFCHTLPKVLHVFLRNFKGRSHGDDRYHPLLFPAAKHTSSIDLASDMTLFGRLAMMRVLDQVNRLKVGSTFWPSWSKTHFLPRHHSRCVMGSDDVFRRISSRATRGHVLVSSIRTSTRDIANRKNHAALSSQVQKGPSIYVKSAAKISDWTKSCRWSTLRSEWGNAENTGLLMLSKLSKLKTTAGNSTWRERERN